MRAAAVAVIVVSSALAFTAGWASGQQGATSKPALHQQTKKNLETAMKGEAFAYARYMLYAQQARRNGHPEVASLFERAAQMERLEHFAEQAKLAGLVGTDEENLRAAIEGESGETRTMYPSFARQAREVGDIAAAERFEEIARDEGKHRDAFEQALTRLQGTGGASTEGQ